MKRILWFLALWLVGCAIDPPPGVKPVSDCDLDRYLGHWYEIARLDHSFERDLTHVRATYSAMADGRIEVVNRGYDSRVKSWQEIRGTARLAGRPWVWHVRDILHPSPTVRLLCREASAVVAISRAGPIWLRLRRRSGCL